MSKDGGSKGFEELLSFPSVFMFRIIAYNMESVVQDCSNVLIDIFGNIEAVEAFPSESHRFLRIHIAVMAIQADQLYKGYDSLKDVEGVRMVF